MGNSRLMCSAVEGATPVNLTHELGLRLPDVDPNAQLQAPAREQWVAVLCDAELRGDIRQFSDERRDQVTILSLRACTATTMTRSQTSARCSRTL